MNKPWESEPDHVEFEHAGFPCIIHRVASHRALCGYVGVPKGHRAYGADGDSRDELPIDVHGGLTYSQVCHGEICHKPKEGESDDVWWLGFDCCHYGDYAPGLFSSVCGDKAIYRNIGYVTDEVKSLAEQLRQMA